MGARVYIRSTVLAAIILIVGLIFVYSPATGLSVSNKWSDVTSANISTSEEPGVTWKSWYLPFCTLENATVIQHTLRYNMEVCSVKSSHTSLISYRTPNTDSDRYALRRDSDSEYHLIQNVYPPYGELTLLPNDTILGASDINEDKLWLYRLQSFHNYIADVQIQNGPDIYNTVYDIDLSKIEQFTDSQGKKPSVHYIATSKNGKYVAAQVLGQGILRLSLETGAMKMISNDVSGHIDTILAISDDGNTVAITGDKDAPHRIYTDIDNCGGAKIYTRLSSDELCPYVSFSDEIMPELESSTLYNPEINDTNFTVHAWNESEQRSRKIVLTPDMTSYRLDYLAIGDSYSSGEGDYEKDAGGGSYYLPGTDSGLDTCHDSSRSYPFLLRNKWSIANNAMRSVACSGAQVVFDYYGKSLGYLGQSQRLKDRSDIQSLQNQALRDFTPGRVHQVEFVKKYQPKVVTLTGGGNDVGFADVLRYCATPHWEDFISIVNSDCDYAQKGSELEKMLYGSIDTQYDYNKLMLQALKEASPKTKIVIIGYPSFIKDSVKPCMPNSGSLSRAEIQMINNMVDRMNSMLKKLAYDMSVGFVDITDSLNGGRICEGSEYMTGVWPQLNNMASESEMFHPNAKGHQRIAEEIFKKYEFGASAIPSNNDFEKSTSITTRMLDFVKSGVTFLHNSTAIKTITGIFAPHSIFTVMMHSEPTDLGEFTTNEDGSIDVNIPTNNVPIGRHTLVVTGTGVDGKPVRLYQFIEVHASKDDADGDGIKDSEDRCQFIVSWYDELNGENICDPPRLQDTKSANSVGNKISMIDYDSLQTEDGIVSHDNYDVRLSDKVWLLNSDKRESEAVNKITKKNNISSSFKDEGENDVSAYIIASAGAVISSIIIGWRIYVRSKSN